MMRDASIWTQMAGQTRYSVLKISNVYPAAPRKYANYRAISEQNARKNPQRARKRRSKRVEIGVNAAGGRIGRRLSSIPAPPAGPVVQFRIWLALFGAMTDWLLSRRQGSEPERRSRAAGLAQRLGILF